MRIRSLAQLGSRRIDIEEPTHIAGSERRQWHFFKRKHPLHGCYILIDHARNDHDLEETQVVLGVVTDQLQVADLVSKCSRFGLQVMIVKLRADSPIRVSFQSPAKANGFHARSPIR